MTKLILILLLSLPCATKADIINTYTFDFSGLNSANTGTETISGSISINQSLLAAHNDVPWTNTVVNYQGIGVTDFNITVSGSSGTNFTSNSFLGGIIFVTHPTGTLDLSKDFISQGAVIGFNSNTLGVNGFLSDGRGGFSYSPHFSISGTDNATLMPTSPTYLSTGFRYVPGISPVPEPSSWVLGLGGLMGMTVLASRKKKAIHTKAPALMA